MLVAALGDTALRVWAAKISKQLEMLEMLDNRFALEQDGYKSPGVYINVHQKIQLEARRHGFFMDDFEYLFTELERIGA